MPPKTAVLPAYLLPMLSSSAKPFDDPGCVFEVKWDGRSYPVADFLLSSEELQIADLRRQGVVWVDIAARLGGAVEGRRSQLSRALNRLSRELVWTSLNATGSQKDQSRLHGFRGDGDGA